MRTSFAVAALLAGVSAEEAKHVQIVEGILEGALGAKGVSDIEKCIQDGEKIVQDYEAALKDFEQGHAGDVIDGLKRIADAFMVVKAGMKDCSSFKADWNKLEAMADKFANLKDFEYRYAEALFVNGQDIYADMADCAVNYQRGSWNFSGLTSGRAAAKVLAADEQEKKEAKLAMEHEAQKKQMAAVMKGVLNQFGGKFNLWDLLNCIQYEDKAAIGVDIGVQSLEKAAGEWATDKKSAVSDAFGGLIALFAAFQSAKQGLPVCKAVWQEVEQLDELKKATEVLRLRNASDVIRLLEDDIQINGYTVIYELSQLLAAAKNKDYEQVGDVLGKIMKLSIREKANAAQEKFVLQAPAPETSFKRTEMTEIIQGFLAGMEVGKINFLDLLMCINNADQAAMILYQDVAMFKEAWAEKDAMEGVAAAITLVGVMQDVKQQVLPVCEAINQTTLTWNKYEKMVETLEDPVAHINAIEHNVVMNGKVITTDLKLAMADFYKKNLYGFGYKVAEALTSATEHDDKSLFLY